jgi:hypothetical protein
MEEVAMYGTVADMVTFMQYGGIFNRSIQDEMVNNALNVFAEVNDDSHEEAIGASQVLFWLLLRGHVSDETKKWLKEQYLKYPFTMPDEREKTFFISPDANEITLRERLTPLVLALILGDDAQADIRAVNEALIFAAAHGNGHILALLLARFPPVLTDKSISEALEAAALQGQLNAFRDLIDNRRLGLPGSVEQLLRERASQGDAQASSALAESRRLRGIAGLISALEKALMLAAAQMHEDIVLFMLDLDREQGLNLDLLSVVDRLELLLGEDLSDERRKKYAYLLALVGDYLSRRYSERIASGPPQEQPARNPQTGALIPQLPPEMLAYALTFLRPSYKGFES